MDESLRKRLVEFYAKHNPVRLQRLDEIIESWRDDEDGLFEALREKYCPNEGTHSDEADTVPVESVEYVPPNLTPLQQLTYRSQKMERILTDLFVAPYDSRHEGSVSDFRDNAAAFSEICLGILKNLSASPDLNREVGAEDTLRVGKSPREQNQGSTFRDSNFPVDSTADHDPLVHDVMPLDIDTPADSVLSTVIRTKCRDGDILNIHPGTYRDNISIVGMRIQLRAVGTLHGRPVTFVPANESVPLLHIGEQSVVGMSGLAFSSNSDATAHPVPLVVADGGSTVSIDECAFSGGGGGAMIGGKGTSMQMQRCTLRNSQFAGVYVKGDAKAEFAACEFEACEVGVRVRDARIGMNGCRASGCTSDGITFHGRCSAALANTEVANNKENGVMLSPTSTVSFTSCQFITNGQFGIYVPAGSEYFPDGCTFSNNAMGSFNRPATLTAS